MRKLDYNHFIKGFLIILSALFLNGCVVMNMISSGLVNENLEPQSVMVEQNGNIAIKAKGSYYRYGFFMLFFDDHFGWIMESDADEHNSDDEDYKEYPVWSHKPNIRYLLLNWRVRYWKLTWRRENEAQKINKISTLRCKKCECDILSGGSVLTKVFRFGAS